MVRAAWGAPQLNQALHSNHFGSHTLALVCDRGPLCLLRFSLAAAALVATPQLSACTLLQQRLRFGELKAAMELLRRVPDPAERHRCFLLLTNHLLRLPTLSSASLSNAAASAMAGAGAQQSQSQPAEDPLQLTLNLIATCHSEYACFDVIFLFYVVCCLLFVLVVLHSTLFFA